MKVLVQHCLQYYRGSNIYLVFATTIMPNNSCLIVCDRFHYKSHKCTTVFDPNSYRICDNHATSGAESLNNLWTFSKSHLRFIGSDNLMLFLAARSVFLNIRASIREKTKKTDITTKQFTTFIRDYWKCNCSRCLV